MLVSLNWIKEFVTVTETNPQKISDILTEKSAEVEEIHSQGKDLENIVVAEIKEITDHPDADALRICQVDAGENEDIQVVCGGSNLERGQKIVLAKVGASVLWHGEGEPVVMKKTKIRGVESLGMICAAEEVGISDIYPKKAEKEIVNLGEISEKNGTPLSEFLGLDDTIFEIENTSITNRADLFSHVGFAREFLATGLAISNSSFQNLGGGHWGDKYLESKIADCNDDKTCEYGSRINPTPKLPSQFSGMTEENNLELSKFPVIINFTRSPEEILKSYAAISISGVNGKTQSPEKMKKLLKSVDIEPKNALVDITNFVMFELGMPLHAFDKNRVGSQWNFELTKGGETMINLDGDEKTLPENAIILTDETGEIFDMCGIQGGKNSGIENSTTEIIVHAPVYDPVKIRRASIAVDQRTDASIIYEKSVSAALAKQGLIRAIELIQEIFPEAKIESDILYKEFVDTSEKTIEITTEQITKRLGIEISQTEIEDILKKLGFELTTGESQTCPSRSRINSPSNTFSKFSGMTNIFKVKIPYFREGDISIPEDLTEEIARIYGLNTIPGIAPQITIAEKPKLPARMVEQQISQVLVNNGAYEVLTLAFYGKKLLERMKMPTENEQHIHLANPLSEDLEIMRTSLSPRLFEVAERNARHTENFRIFESGKVFRMENGEKIEEQRITALLSGDDFFAAKAIAEDIFASFAQTPRIQAKEYPLSFAHPGRGAEMIAGKDANIKVFEIHPSIAKEFGLPKNSSIVCATLAPFANLLGKTPKMKELPRFPGIDFDVSVVCDESVSAESLTKNLNRTNELITKAEVESVWRGEGVEDGEKSVTLSFEFRAADRTLTDKEAKAIEKKLMQELEKRGAVARF